MEDNAKLFHTQVTKAYQHRFKRLFIKLTRILKAFPLIERKRVILRLWNNATQKILSIKFKKATTFRFNTIAKKVLTAMQSNSIYSKSLSSSLVAVKDSKDYRLQNKIFSALKSYCKRLKIIKQFRIEKFKNFLIKIIKSWSNIKNERNKKRYLLFKAEEFRFFQIPRRYMNKWKKYLINQAELRRISIYFGYWKKMHRKLLLEFENYTIGCRKRHLKSIYFKYFKVATEISKNERKADSYRLLQAFRRFRRRALRHKLRRMKILSALQECNIKLYDRIVNAK